MKKILKKSILLLIVALLLIGTSTFTFAHDNINKLYNVDSVKDSEFDVDEFGKFNTIPSGEAPMPILKDEPMPIDDSNVAILYIYATTENQRFSSATIGDGHAFLVFENTSDKNLKLGPAIVQPHTKITLGTFGEEKEHSGLWFDLEGYIYKHYGTLRQCATIGVRLNEEWVQVASDKVIDGDYWHLFQNCSSFAVNVWNAVCTLKLSAGSPINTPTHLKAEMETYTDNCFHNLEVPHQYRVAYGKNCTNSTVYAE